MIRTCVLLVLLPIVAACAAGCPAADPSQQLMEADREFARATAEHGLDGWMSYMAEDAVRVEMQGEIVRGLDAIRKFDGGMFEDPSMRLVWEPTEAGGFATGDHGFTRGRYRVVRADGDGDPEVISAGTYLTLWRLDDGEWKVILDTGVPDSD